MKRSRWIWIVITLLICFLLVLIGRLTGLVEGQHERDPVPQLNFVFLSESEKTYSLSPLTADQEQNDKVISSLVGTLLRPDLKAGMVPYLASSYHVSDDGLEWKFKFRPGLKAEDGTQLSAEGYVRSFKRLITLYMKEFGAVPYFDALIGFKEFTDGGADFPGVQAIGDEIIFRFSHRPEVYLVIYAVPLFGYYVDSDFHQGSWKDPKKLTSTSLYKIFDLQEHSAILKLRDDWFLSTDRKPGQIDIRTVRPAAELKTDQGATILKVDEMSQTSRPGFQTVEGVPQWMVALVLNPKSTPSITSRQRATIVATWLKVHREEMLRTPRSNSSPKFNFLDQYDEKIEKIEALNSISADSTSQQIVDVGVISALSKDEIQFLDLVFSEIRKNTGIQFQIKRLESDLMEDLLSDKLTPARINSVVVGANANNMNNQVMFTTKLGICFPDPSKRIADLINEYARGEKKLDQEYLNRFLSYLREDGAVLPLFHRSNVYLVSEELAKEDIPADIDNAPLYIFEL